MKYAMLLLVAALMLSACAGKGNSGGAGSSETPTVELAPEPVREGEDAPTVAAPVSQQGEEADVITAPVLAGTLLGYSVAGPDGAVGDVTGIVADLLTGQVRSISMLTVDQEAGRNVLLPWGTFQIVVFPPGENPTGAEPAPQVWLEASADVAGAPQFDPQVLENPGDLSANWDADSTSYWSERMPGLPATGTEDRADGLVYLRDEQFSRIEFDLVDTQGETLGEIKDLVIGEGGVMRYGILDPRGELAQSGDLVVVGWKAVSWIPEEGRFVLNVPAERLSEAPHFLPTELPDTTLPGWDTDWMAFWQDAGTPSAGAIVTPTDEGVILPVNARAVLDQPVVDREGNELGRLVDWWMTGEGLSQYAILQEEARLVLVPWIALDWNTAEGQMVLNLDPSLLMDAPSFPNVTEMDGDTGWRNAANEYWQSFMQVAEQGVPTTAAPMESPAGVRVMRLIDGPVFGPAGENLGMVEDLVFNPDGQVAYIAIREGEILRLTPWMDFQYDQEEGVLKYLDDLARLSEAPSVTGVEAYDLSIIDWDAELRTYWGMK